MTDDVIAGELAQADGTSAEKAVLSICLFSPADAMPIAITELGDSDFSDPLCRRTFRVLRDLHVQGAAIAGQIVWSELIRRHGEGWPGGAIKIPGFVSGLGDHFGYSGNLAWYIAKIRERAQRERLLRELSLVQEFAGRGSDGDGNEFSLADATARLRGLLDEAAPDQQRGRFMCLSEFEAAEDEFPPVENLWDDLTLASGTIALLAGRTGHGKSFLAVQLGVCLTGGVAFLQRKTAQCPVLYLQSEIADSALLSRFRGVLPKLCEGMTAEQVDAIRRNLIIRTESAEFCLYKTPDRFSHNGKRPTVSSPEACLAAVENEIARRGIRLVILDPWSDLVRINELDGGETAEALGRLKQLSQRHGVGWFIVHHVPKSVYQSSTPLDTSSPRGHSKLADSASTVLTLSPAPTPNAATHCVFAATKTRYRPEPEPMILRRPMFGSLFFSLDPTLRPSGRPIPGEQEVVDALTAAAKPIFRVELRDRLAEAYGVDPRTARRWITGAQDGHKVRYDPANQKYSIRQEEKP